MRPRTHLQIDKDLNGKILELREGYAKVELATTKQMIVDKHNLIHGGFTFCLGDYTAMLTVNDPHVLLTAAQVKFLKPVVLGDLLISEGEIENSIATKPQVKVGIHNDQYKVFSGKFNCYIPDKHILEG
ncbi:MAG: thioesterase [Candidatus Lokiarchaeota archaeon]|nr:thioesterase [Candidatus Lokiarchaeota archaeon]MBD3198909.1 thioesterase [Candidatus Lokiarchaeota archaeon]